MARRFTRRRWRRPQRLTLEGPTATRRKDIVVSEVVVLDHDEVTSANNRRVAGLLALFVAVALVEGLVIGLAAGAPVVGAAVGAVVGALLLAAVSRLGDGWLERALGCTSVEAGRIEHVYLLRASSAAGIEPPRVLEVPGAAPNALALGIRRRCVVITEGTRSLGHLEAEALISRQVGQLHAGDGRLASMQALLAAGPAIGLRSLPSGIVGVLTIVLFPAVVSVRVAARALPGADDVRRADITGALLCRFPPGMQRLLDVLSGEHEPSAVPAIDGFWAAPRTRGSTERLRTRAALVAEM